MKKAKQWVVGLLVLAVLLLGAGMGVARAQETFEIAGVVVDLSKSGTITGNSGIEVRYNFLGRGQQDAHAGGCLY